jgi:histidyl-tRNA synthetase
MKPTISSVKGTRDFYPEEMSVRNFLYRTARKVSESFGYQEWDAPFLETIDLYAAKSGEELVKEQAFVFHDRSGDLITLRPELTPSLARLVAQRQRQLVYPLRWWSWGPFWRYERPQKGRTREFFQWNIDLIGVDTPEADAEMVAIAASFLREAGLAPDQVSVLVNNRKLLEEELSTLGVSSNMRIEIFHLIDRRDKMPPGEWQAYAAELGLNYHQLDGLKSMLADDQLWQKSQSMQRFFAAIDSLGVAEYVRFAPHIVRGLDYYTSVVWEAWDKDGEFRAILGGGRYDNLVSDVGGEPLPATGFAMGDLVASLVLKKYGCLSENLGSTPALVLVTVFNESFFQASYSLSAQLRRSGIETTVYPEAASLSRQFKYGDRMRIKLAIVLGPDEQESKQVTIKDLHSGKQSKVASSEIVETIHQMIA